MNAGMSAPAGSIRVAVLGAGAVGCYFGGMLARAGHAVTLIGRPVHVDAFRKNGLHFEGLKFDEHIPVMASTVPDAALLRSSMATVLRRAASSPSQRCWMVAASNTGMSVRPGLARMRVTN